MNHLSSSATLISKKVKFECITRDNPPVIVDYTSPIGDGEGYTSLELFLVSLSTCAASSMALLLRKRGFTLDGLTVEASGERRQLHPTCFEKVVLDFTFTSPDLTNEGVGEALALSENSICPVWAMIKGNVTVEPRYTIRRSVNSEQ